MLAFAFDKTELPEEVIAIECAQCFKEPHAVLQPFEGTEADMYAWMQGHTKEKTHTEFRTYRIDIRRSRTALVPVDDA